jgi:hypothetical protein
LCGSLLVARSHQEFVCLDLGSRELSTAASLSSSNAEMLSGSSATGWFARHYSPVFHMPEWRDQWRWFLECLLGSLVPGAVLSRIVRGDQSRRRVVFYVIAWLLSVAGTWILTEIMRSFAFTWPATLFLSLAMTLEVRAWARQHQEFMARAAARLVLAVFVLGLGGYWWLCRSVFLIAGQSYLVGLLPAIPATVWTVNLSRRSGRLWPALGVGLAAFGVCFWVSAVALWWRTRLN